MESTHGQPASCRARPMTVDDGLEDIRWIRGLGGEKLPAASYALLPNLKKGLFFAIREGSRNFVAYFLHSSAQCVCIRRLAGVRHLSPVVLWTLWPEGGSEPLTGAPIHISWRSRWFCRSMSVEDSVSRRFEQAFGWVFLRPVTVQDRSRNCFFSGFLKRLKIFNRRLVLLASGTESFGWYLWNSNVLWKHRVSIVTALSVCTNLFHENIKLRVNQDSPSAKRRSSSPSPIPLLLKSHNEKQKTKNIRQARIKKTNKPYGPRNHEKLEK